MAITKLPNKPFVSVVRSKKIDRFFKSKKRFDQQGFLEVLFKIKLVGGTSKTEYGYSKEFDVSSNAQYRQALEDNYFNALGKVMHREGLLFETSDDIQSIDDSDVQEVKMLDYNIYYPNFKDEKTIRIQRTRKDGSKSISIRFTRRGKFVEGGGLEDIQKDQQKTNDIFRNREESFSKTREEAKRRQAKIDFSKKFK